MSPKSKIMSGKTKQALAEELGFADKVAKEGWSSITAGEAGSMVKRAVEQAEKQLVNKETPKSRPGSKSGERKIGPGSGAT